MGKDKMVRLQAALRDMRSVAVAFSAGVDSTFLLRVERAERWLRDAALDLRGYRTGSLNEILHNQAPQKLSL